MVQKLYPFTIRLAVVSKGKYAGVYTGVVAVRASGYFDIKDVRGKVLAQGLVTGTCVCCNTRMAMLMLFKIRKESKLARSFPE